MLEINRYKDENKEEWNGFARLSKQGTFLFDRNYMDYHSDRFSDHSLMIYREGSLVALLPANETDKSIVSHQGLTYGGLLTNEKTKAADVIEIFESLTEYYKSNGINRIVYKPIPWIYHRIPSEEDLYTIYNTHHAKITAREISSTIFLQARLKWSHGKMYRIKKVARDGVIIGESNDYEAFWEILNDNLKNRYDTKPVHTLQEMNLLHERFPDNIRLYTARKDNHLLGGILIYVTPYVIHTQYISATPDGKKEGVVDAICHFLLDEYADRYPYFDFGKSTENQGTYLNESLIAQKEGLGGRAVCYDTYEWEL